LLSLSAIISQHRFTHVFNDCGTYRLTFSSSVTAMTRTSLASGCTALGTVIAYRADPMKLLRLPGCNGCFDLPFVFGPNTRNFRNEVRQKLTGHTSAETNKVYTHHELDALRAAVSVIPRIGGK
jgi:hypothetical protein